MTVTMILMLYIVGLVMVVAETLLPGVVMGIVGLGCVVGSIVMSYQHIGVGAVIVESVVAAVLVPAAIILAVRKLQLRDSLDPAKGAVGVPEDFDGLAGREGEAFTDLKPGGVVIIEGKKFDVISTGEHVNRTARVRVVKVEGNRVYVRPA
jgi:membrane-bound serine protease (ClpP class)